MATYKTKCRLCGKMTDHIERVVTDNLPPYVKSLQCVKCGVMGIVLMHSYEYECIVCNVRYETVEKMAEHTTPYCCSMMMRQIYSAPGISFKGTGWGKDA